ncbi:hypothetical protein ON010_g3658 [Phytophthora cinnamomi]|nr:hypothetical protein ON010_g3658 [Phytophthora cinnamomi]
MIHRGSEPSRDTDRRQRYAPDGALRGWAGPRRRAGRDAARPERHQEGQEGLPGELHVGAGCGAGQAATQHPPRSTWFYPLIGRILRPRGDPGRPRLRRDRRRPDLRRRQGRRRARRRRSGRRRRTTAAGPTAACNGSETESEDDEDKQQLIKPDPYLPEAYQRRATVLRHAGSFYDAMLTRVGVSGSGAAGRLNKRLTLAVVAVLWAAVLCAGSSAQQPQRVHRAAGPGWDERHALRYQEGSYTWIELDYSTGTPYSESLTSALADNQGEMDNADSFRDFDLVPTSPPPLPLTSTSSRKRRRAAMWTTYSSAASTTPATPSTGVRRSLSNQLDWLYANSDGDTASAASSETATCACATAPQSRLPTEVQDFLTLIADHTELSYAYTVTDDLLGDAIMKLPLGRLSKTTIKRVRRCYLPDIYCAQEERLTHLFCCGQGYETLEEIYEALRSRQVSRARLTNLSSHFYSLIPHHSRLEVIDTMVKLGKKIQLMAEVGASVRGMAHEPVARRCASRNYLDECYDLLECELQPVKSSDPDFALIQTYIRNSNCCGRKQDRLQLLSVFRVEKPEQETRFEPFRKFANRRILWHGSHLANWLGILSEGLRIAPPEVASNGRTFGKGLYFTDKVTKAQAYCHCRPTNGHNQCVFALSEVALGESKEMLNSDDNAKQFVHTGAGGRAKGAYYHSCKGVGSCRPDSAGEVVDIHGAVWPVGKPVQPEERTGLHHKNELVTTRSMTAIDLSAIALLTSWSERLTSVLQSCILLRLLGTQSNGVKTLDERRMAVVVSAVQRIRVHVGQVLDRELRQARLERNIVAEVHSERISLELVLARVQSDQEGQHVLHRRPHRLRKEQETDDHGLGRVTSESEAREQLGIVHAKAENVERGQDVHLLDDKALCRVPEFPVAELVAEHSDDLIMRGLLQQRVEQHNALAFEQTKEVGVTMAGALGTVRDEELYEQEGPDVHVEVLSSPPDDVNQGRRDRESDDDEQHEALDLVHEEQTERLLVEAVARFHHEGRVESEGDPHQRVSQRREGQQHQRPVDLVVRVQAQSQQRLAAHRPREGQVAQQQEGRGLQLVVAAADEAERALVQAVGAALVELGPRRLQQRRLLLLLLRLVSFSFFFFLRLLLLLLEAVAAETLDRLRQRLRELLVVQLTVLADVQVRLEHEDERHEDQRALEVGHGAGAGPPARLAEERRLPPRELRHCSPMAAPWRALPLVCAASSDTGATLQVSPDARDALLSIHAQHQRAVVAVAASRGRYEGNGHCARRPGHWGGAGGRKRGEPATGAAAAALVRSAVQRRWRDRRGRRGEDAVGGEGGSSAEDQGHAGRRGRRWVLVSLVRGAASEFHEHAPKFVWLGRNFKVKWLKGSDGQRLTPREYFDQSLAPESGYGEAATKRNMLRMYLESYFPARDCVVLSRAVEGIGTEVVPPETPRSELRTQFVEAVDDMYENYLSDNAQQLPVKKLMGHELRSEQFVAVLEAYLDAINAGRLPAMQTASNTLLEQEVGEAFEVAKQTYIAEMQAVKSFKKEGGNDGERALSERKLQLAHFRGIQTAMAHLREVRSSLPERLQKTLFKDKLAELDSQMKLDFQATLERNTTLSAEICMKILERVLPRNLEDMATELAERPRDDFSDGLVRLLTQYKSDLRSALDEYMQQGSGPAVHSCLEEALLQSVRASIQKWGAMVLRQYQKHMQSWQEEKEQLDNAYEHAKVQDTETATLANNQKHSYEEQLAQATEKLSELRRVLHSELNSKKRELERLTTEITTMNLKHEVRMKNAESDLAWARSRAEELEKSIVADRQRQEGISAAAARVLEKQLNFHKEERSLLVQQKELMAQIVQLERELVQKKTKHAQKVFALQNEHAKKIDAMRMEQAKFERQLKSQAKKDLSSLKLAHEKEMKAISSENASLDKEMADIQERLAVFEAEEEAARASAAASRDFFKSMPLIQLPLMQAPAAAAGEHQPAQHSTKSLTPNSSSVPVRFGSLDDTSTSSASPLARDESPQT